MRADGLIELDLGDRGGQMVSGIGVGRRTMPKLRPMGSRVDELVEGFELLDDWQDRYRYIIELGRELPELPAEEKTEQYKVKGCMSQVWLIPEQRSDDGKKLYFRADSDAHIVRGLVAILLAIFSGKTPEEILDTDPRPIFESIGLDKHLSTGRSNGLLSMVGRIKESAREAVEA